VVERIHPEDTLVVVEGVTRVPVQGRSLHPLSSFEVPGFEHIVVLGVCGNKRIQGLLAGKIYD